MRQSKNGILEIKRVKTQKLKLRTGVHAPIINHNAVVCPEKNVIKPANEIFKSLEIGKDSGKKI